MVCKWLRLSSLRLEFKNATQLVDLEGEDMVPLGMKANAKVRKVD